MRNVGPFDSVARELLGRLNSEVLHAEWIGVGKPLQLMCPERRNSPAFIEPDVFVELPWQHNFEVVAGELAFGPINHPNGPLKPQP